MADRPAEIMDVPEAARFLGVAEPTLRRWLAEGQVPHSRVGGEFHFQRHALLQWLDTQQRQPLGGEGPCRLPDLPEAG
jgi:excisionase family DNA binding protein